MLAPLPEAVRTEMARREHRTHHFLWHAVRNGWGRMSQAQRQAVRNIDPRWEPPRATLDAAGNVLRDNDSGEDFLYMHRQMIAQVNAILAAVNDPAYPRIQGWTVVPAPGDVDYPVPVLPGLDEVKSDAYYQNVLRPWETQYRDPAYLHGVTLGQLGADLEFTIHNDLHMRWAAPSAVGFRPNGPITAPIEERWDAPAYDFLGDTYSSHVNPIFWKLHGWVDERIDDWVHAHDVTGPIAWRGMWVGAARHMHHGLREVARAGETKRVDDVMQIVSEATGFDGFFRLDMPGRTRQ